MSEILKIFEQKKPVITYITAGDPSLALTKKMLLNLEKAGADIVELGIPFSDPLADGPTIQASHYRAIQRGANLVKILGLVKELRPRVKIPIIFMGAANLFLAYGLKQFFADAREAGVNGLIIPDLPPEEAGDFIYLGQNFNLDIIFLASTASSEDRLKMIAEKTMAFIYLISSKGLTGERAELPVEEIQQTIAKLKNYTTKPIAVGFGVSTPEQAATVLNLSDGVIIGSAIVARLEHSLGQALGFIKKIVKKVSMV